MDYLSPLAPWTLFEVMHKTIRSFRLAGAWGADPFSPGAYVEWAEMATADEEPLRITTDRVGSVYGLAVYRGAVQDPGAVLQWWETDQGSRLWILGKVIDTVDLYFEKNVLVGPAGERVDRLQDVRLVLDGDVVVFLSAASWMSETTVKVAEDSIAVVSGDEGARRLRLGPYSQLQAEGRLR